MSPRWSPAHLPPAAGWTAAGPPRRRSWSSGPVLACVAAVVLLLAGGSAAWAASRSTEPAPGAAAPGPLAATHAPAPTTVTVAATPEPTVPIYPARSYPTSDLVTFAAGGADTLEASAVQSLLTRHFTAVNSLDYESWASTVTSSRSRDQSRGTWLNSYRSTQDSGVIVQDIAPTGASSALVYVNFVSSQDVADAPADLRVPRICWYQQLR
jgi:hypothetical protein